MHPWLSAALTSTALLAIVSGSAEGRQRTNGTLTPCTLGGSFTARCGYVEVPENRSANTGRILGLYVAVVPARAAPRLADPIVTLVGGPGQGAATQAASFAGPFSQLFPDRDLLFIDQRGSGRSNGLFCADDIDSIVPVEALADVFPLASMVRCRNSLVRRADLRHYTTAPAADDLADVLSHLGYELANLVAVSYGTRLAQVFLRRHPNRVRTIAMAGVVAMDMRPPLYYARDAQHSLDGVVGVCMADRACRQAHPTLNQDLERMWDAFADGPIDVEVHHPRLGGPVTVAFERRHAAYGLRGLLYRVAGQDALPTTIGDAARGRWEPIANAYISERLRGFATGLYLSVLCGEEVRRFEESDVSRAAGQTFLGPYVPEQLVQVCAQWPVPRMPDEYYRPVRSDVPVLLISGELDPVTPPVWAARVAAGFSNHLHVIVPAGGHGVTEARGNPRCLGSLLAQLVRTASTDLDITCVAAFAKPTFTATHERRP